MISFTSILTTIKGASLTAKIGLSIGAVAVVAGGTAGTIAIVNASKTHEEMQIVASSSNDDNSPSEQEDTQIEETGEPEDDKSESEQTSDNKEPTANNSQTTTQKPSSSTSSSNNQSKPNNNASTSKPSTSTPTQPNKPSQPSQPSQPSTPSQPSQPTQPTKKPDYNLNDKYVAGSRSYPFWILDENGQCSVAEEKSFFGVAKFTGQGDDLWSATMGQQYMNYANSKGYNTMDCLGMGSAPTTWEAVVSAGLALDEAKCAQYGLSCGRW